LNELEFLRGLTVNVFLMLGFVSVCSMANNWMVRHRQHVSVWMSGFLFSCMSVVAMFSPVFTRSDSLMVDCRAGVIGTAAFLGGVPLALMSLVLPMLYRVGMGGPGLMIGLCSMVFAAVLGSLCHFALHNGKKPLTRRDIFLASAVVGFGTDGLVVLFFFDDAVQALRDIGLGGFLMLLSLIPVSMVLLSSFLVREQYHDKLMTAVLDSERRMLHSQKMAAVGQLAHRIAHSVMNVLAVIMGNAERAKAATAGDTRVVPIMDNIIAAVGTLTSLTGELMTFSAPGELRFHRMELAKSLEGVEQLLARVIGSQIRVSIVACADAGVINMDPNLIEQLIMHLAINASEAMNGKGQLTVSMQRTELAKSECARLFADVPESEQHPGAFAVLSVRDTGCGMSEDVVSRMYEPFFTTKGRRENAGLGLSSVYNIVQKHHGSIDVKTHPGCGTTFLVYFPIVG
jgi:signal transduction histidine kinase